MKLTQQLYKLFLSERRFCNVISLSLLCLCIIGEKLTLKLSYYKMDVRNWRKLNIEIVNRLLVCGILYTLISPGTSQILKYRQTDSNMKDSVIFPDQFEYLQTSISSCENKDQIYWPEDNKCYDEFTQGPCPPGQILTFDRQKIEPKCEIINTTIRLSSN